MKRRLFEATVVECRPRAKDIFKLFLRVNQPLEAKPGQFVSLESACHDKIWRRPFSVYNQSDDGKNFSACFKVVGENTRFYSTLIPGEKISVLGPLGNPISINQNAANHILVAGGMGRAGLAFLARELDRLNWERAIFLYGAKNDAELFGIYDLKKVCNRVEIATEAETGQMVTDLLKRELMANDWNGADTEIIACGPNAMLKKVAEIAARWKISCQVVMETLMACGVGSCKGCAIPKRDSKEYFHLCQDGPALPADQVDWDKLERPSMIVPLDQRKSLEEINMQVTLIGQNGLSLALPSPIILDSGTFEADAATDGPVDLTHVGAVSSKGTTAFPKDGNPGPRVCETPSGMMNSIGLENPGLKVFINDKLPELNKLGKTVIANISGSTADEFADMAEELVSAGVKAICLNISCPNKAKGDQIFSLSADDTSEVVKKVMRQVGGKMFVFVKLSPMAPDVAEVALAAEEAGADALWLFNTFLGMKIDLAARRPAIGNVYGGMSGPAVRPMALRLVHLVCKAVHIPVVGDTGIESGADAAEYLIAGAQAVAVGTAILHNPNAGTEIFQGLLERVWFYGMSDIKELSGSLIL